MQLFVLWYIEYFFVAWNMVPLPTRRWIAFTAWKLYLPVHKLILGRSTGIHRDASLEYHALTTFMYWGRYFPVSVPMMRFALHNLDMATDNKETSKVEEIAIDMKISGKNDYGQPEMVTGSYIHSGGFDDYDEKKVIFWIYGGAFLAGDVEGNMSPAEQTGKACGVDVFIPSYRLLPESEYDDMLWDIFLSYRYLVETRRVKPSNIVVLGISSGAGLASQLLQAISERKRTGKIVHYPAAPYLAEILKPDDMPKAGILICPFVDYTTVTGTWEHYQKHDLVVNQAVMEEGIPYLEVKLGKDMANRRRYSPVYSDFSGLPDLCVVTSEHETVHGQTVEFINRARERNVKVTVAIFQYMCHVFCFLGGFCPEGKHCMNFIYDFIKEKLDDD